MRLGDAPESEHFEDRTGSGGGGMHLGGGLGMIFARNAVPSGVHTSERLQSDAESSNFERAPSARTPPTPMPTTPSPPSDSAVMRCD